MLSIIASLCLTAQYFSSPGFTASLVSGHPWIIYLYTICNLGSSCIAVFMFSVDVHMGMSTDLLMLCMVIVIPGIS